ncbi:MAG: LPS export ABC transporter periplasmic protein LptC [Gammaproteobacteria bacterium]|jgi:LPS export ABC transporter protein LptC|nr:LPS export ABC transporter periplasmic protein LptC [Gammaproteobacteria bacterium]
MKRLFSLSLIIIAALIFWGSQTWERSVSIDTMKDSDPHYIDVFIRDFTITIMNEEGRPGHTLKARLLEHYNDDDFAIMNKPVLELLQNEHRWTIVAQRGEIADNNQHISLRDEVIIEQRDVPEPIRLETAQLDIDLRRQIATSCRPVNITQRDFQVKSQGLILDNISGQLEFLNHVEGRYEQLQ